MARLIRKDQTVIPLYNSPAPLRIVQPEVRAPEPVAPKTKPMLSQYEACILRILRDACRPLTKRELCRAYEVTYPNPLTKSGKYSHTGSRPIACAIALMHAGALVGDTEPEEWTFAITDHGRRLLAEAQIGEVQVDEWTIVRRRRQRQALEL